MSGREGKSYEKFKQDLKQFFKSSRSNPGHSQRVREEQVLNADFENELGSEVPITQRIKFMKELTEAVVRGKLEKNSIEKICGCVNDILTEEQYKHYRHFVISLYKNLVQSQYSRLEFMRPYFFGIINNNKSKEDTIQRFELFQILTENGKNISAFEEEVGKFLLEWMECKIIAKKGTEYLTILVNYIKYNSGYIDEYIIDEIVRSICVICIYSNDEEVVSKCLDVLDAVVCYSKLPQQTMTPFITALSRTICLEGYNITSWKIMKNLLGTHMGHFCLQTLCFMLQDINYYEDTGLISGIIYILNMSLLSNKPDYVVGCIPGYIVPGIQIASNSKNPIILIEVLLCVKWTVENYGKELNYPTWDNILTIFETIISKIGCLNSLQAPTYISDILNKIESLYRNNECKADMDQLFSISLKYSTKLPENWILYLTNYYFNRIIVIDRNWTINIKSFITTFIIKETRQSIRINVLKKFVCLVQEGSYNHQEEIINNIIKPFFGTFVFDKDDVIRSITLEFLIKFCLSFERKFMESILEILEKVLKTPFEQRELMSEYSDSDLRTVIQGLLDIFVVSLYDLPSSNAVKILDILVNFLKCHYEKPKALESLVDLRWKVIEFLLNLREDSLCRIGFITDSPNKVKYSTFIFADYKKSSNGSISSSSPINSKSSEGSCFSFEKEFYSGYVFTYISLTNACRLIVTVLKSESDWELLQRVLNSIPIAVKNRALVFSKHNVEVQFIVNTLTSMISDGVYPETLKKLPPRFNKPQFYGYVIPALAAFASYHTHFELCYQQRLISCLQLGLVNRSAPQCITALMICLLEMRETMVKMLPEILLNLSKISATVYVAIPILEFLSLLSALPHVFANFIPNQYMSIFAIIFPYTNPSKYHYYIVSLAHHVIAVWFLKCRRPIRTEFVKYIIKGVKAELGSFDEESLTRAAVSNEDSSDRKRSSSLTEQGNRQKERHMSGSGRLMTSHTSGNASDLQKNIDETSRTFHKELTETCIDLLSRISFTSCSALPKRNPGCQFILRNGLAATWLHGNNIITITTSGCFQRPMHNGYCDKCYKWCIIDKSSQAFNINKVNKPAENSHKFDSADTDSNAKKSSNKQLTRHLSINSEDGNLTENLESGEKRISSSYEFIKQLSIGKDDRENSNVCICWCQGWAEIHIRRPTGDTSWIMRLQNETCANPHRNPLTDISSMYQASVMYEGIKEMEEQERIRKETILKACSKKTENISEPSIEQAITDLSPAPVDSKSQLDTNSAVATVVENIAPDSKQTSENSADDRNSCKIKPVDEAQNKVLVDEGLHEHCCRDRNPVRRSNSSPEMSSNWKNPFIKDAPRSFNSSPVNVAEQCESNDQCSLLECKKLGKHCYSKELRCNCEAIPEEFPGLGTTPPKATYEKVITNFGAVSDIESSGNSPSPSISSSNISQSDKSSSTPQLPPSSSCENFGINDDKKQAETKFFDEQGLPNDDFIFNRSASTSQVTSSYKKHTSSSSYVNLSHSLTTSQPHLTSKPPPSPPIHSLRSIKHGKDSAESKSDSFSNLNQNYIRNRVHTISVMSPAKKSQSEFDERNKFTNQRNYDPQKSGINPSMVFLQLFDSSQFFAGNEIPMVVKPTEANQRAINVFDRIPPYETHKIGVIYVGPGQVNNEKEILRNTSGSPRYVHFLWELGMLVNLSEVNSQNVFLGGLEQNGNDGKYAYIWKNDVMQVTFHVATLMPNNENDANCNNKKRHIGNDYVTIVYNESGEEYNLNTVKCQFNFASIIVEPLDDGTHQVTVKARDDLLQIIGNVETKIVSDKNVSLLARQLALHTNLASLILSSMTQERNCGGIYASNWLERLRKIKQIKKKVLDETGNAALKQTNRRYWCDFTDYA